MVDGFSSSDLKTANQRAPTAPSTTLWSQLIVTLIMLALLYLHCSRVSGGGCECVAESNILAVENVETVEKLTHAATAEKHQCGSQSKSITLLPESHELCTIVYGLAMSHYKSSVFFPKVFKGIGKCSVRVWFK